MDLEEGPVVWKWLWPGSRVRGIRLSPVVSHRAEKSPELGSVRMREKQKANYRLEGQHKIT